jgi:hypothetical protein
MNNVTNKELLNLFRRSKFVNFQKFIVWYIDVQERKAQKARNAK